MYWFLRKEIVYMYNVYSMKTYKPYISFSQPRSLSLTLSLSQSTRVGMSVNAVRKQSSDEEVQILAKALIKSWKKLLGMR